MTGSWGHIAHHHSHLPALTVHIDPESICVARLVRQITFHARLKSSDLGCIHDRIGHVAHIMGLHSSGTQGEKAPLPLEGGRSPCYQKEIGCACTHHLLQTRKQPGVAGMFQIIHFQRLPVAFPALLSALGGQAVTASAANLA